MRTLTLACIALTSALSGCGTPGTDSESSAPETVAAQETPIVYGTADTTHHAVVAVLSNESACTGTIIKVNGNTGFVLTAAHCCDASDPPVAVVQGNNYNASSGNIQYSVLDVKAHPSYNFAGEADDPYDFCMLKIGGTNASTPVIAALTPAQDTLAVGKQIEVVGYGLIENRQNNSRRNKAMVTIDSIASLQFGFSFNNSGICSGDSGGPALYTVGGTQYVAGVASFSDEYCQHYGGEGRVSAVYNSFILPYLNGQPGTQTCDECFSASTSGQGTCTGSIDACFDHPGCNAFAACIQDCSTNACQQACGDAHPSGIQKYLAIYDCVCTTGCPSTCGGTDLCADPPAKCYFEAEDASCNSCIESSCCDASLACANDDTCIRCFGNNPPSNCNANPAYQAFAQCLDTTCGSTCGDESSSGAGGSATGAGGSTVGAGGGGGAGGADDGGPVGTWTPGDDDDDDDTTTTTASCSIGANAGSASGAASAGWLGGLAIALAAAARRRRA